MTLSGNLTNVFNFRVALFFLIFALFPISFSVLAQENEAAESEDTKQIVVEEKQSVTEETDVQTLTDIQNPESDLKVEIWTDNKNTEYKIGEVVTFYFKTNKDAHLTLINIGTSGNVHQIFPNKYQTNNFVEAGKTYSIPADEAPFQFKLQSPAGTDTVKAIATLNELILLSQAGYDDTELFLKIDQPEETIARDIAITLAPIDKKTWGEADLELKVVE